MTVSISNIAANWTDGTKVYTGIGLKVTTLGPGSGYDPGSKVIDLKVNGSSVFYVDAVGTLFAANLSIANANVSVDFSPVFIKTNAAYSVANTAFDYANGVSINTASAFSFANNLSNFVIASFNSSNTVYTFSNSVYNFANNIYAAVNSSFGVINSAFNSANTVGGYANSAGGNANQAGIIANAAFNKANSIVVSVDISPPFNVANAAFAKANSAFDFSIPAYDLSQFAYGGANQAGIIANAAFGKANAANVLAYDTGIGANAYTNISTLASNNYAGVMANSSNNRAGAMANSVNAYTTATYVTITTVETNIFSANNYAGAMANSSNGYTVTSTTAANNYAGVMANSVNVGTGTSVNAYAGVMANSANAWANTKISNNINQIFWNSSNLSIMGNVGINTTDVTYSGNVDSIFTINTSKYTGTAVSVGNPSRLSFGLNVANNGWTLFDHANKPGIGGWSGGITQSNGNIGVGLTLGETSNSLYRISSNGSVNASNYLVNTVDIVRSQWNDKTVAVLGDSISSLYDWVGDALKPLGASIVRFTRNGRSSVNLLRRNDGSGAGTPLTSSDFTDKSAVNILIGTNDWGSNVPLGFSNDSVSTATFYGYMKNAVSTIQTWNPNTNIVLNTIIYRNLSGTESPTNSLGLTINDYNNAIKKVGSLYNVFVLDLNRSSLIDSSNYSVSLGSSGAVYYPGTTNLSGTVSVTSGGTTVTGVSTSFTTDFLVYDRIIIAGTEGRIASIASDTSLTVDTITWPTTLSSQTYTKRYFGGDGLHPTANGYQYMSSSLRQYYNSLNTDAAKSSNSMPAFNAHRSSSAGNQGIPGASYSVVTYDTEEYDTDNCFNPTTGRFTPTVAGYYMFTGGARVSANAGFTIPQTFVSLAKNGVANTAGSASYTAADVEALSTVSGMLYMNGTTDYVELFVYVANNSIVRGNYLATRFSGCMLRGA